MAQTGGDPPINPHLVQLKIVIMMVTSHFETPGLLDDQRIDHAMQACRQVIEHSKKALDIRLALGHSREVWVGLRSILARAILQLERQSFPVEDSSAAGYNPSASGHVTGNHIALVRDVDCINDICLIARNMLVTNQTVQDLAADAKFDQYVLKLTEVCVRVCARGYDGEANPRAEERWHKIIYSYKKLLVTGIQFLHNLIMDNERRKLLLWMDLFGNSPCADSSFMGRVDPAAYFPPEDFVSRDQLVEAAQTLENLGIGDVPQLPQASVKPDNQTDSSDAALGTRFQEADVGSPAESLSMSILRQTAVHSQPGASLMRQPSNKRASGPRGSNISADIMTHMLSLPDDVPALNARSIVSPRLNESNFNGLGGGKTVAPTDDESMPCTPADAAHSLRFAKEQLVDRLFGRHESPAHVEVDDLFGEDQDDDEEDDAADASETAAQGSVDDEDENGDEDEDEDDEDDVYPGTGDQERGLLTDVPLVLGPAEIEALPMIVQAGIVDKYASKNPEGIYENMQAIRCNILISQESGRNLLRELLIFVAAWDLTDDELYFKVMVQIMEAVLVNGLIPYTYQSFAETKDIISPPQAVIIKLLTQIFRGKTAQTVPTGPSAVDRAPGLRVYVLVIRFIFAHFRQSVIPETCGLIYLQGQIRRGQISADDFPLNFWDMERVYEGVYQFLEFLAVLTEIESWKRLLVKWEITFELVVLLRELQDAIPNGRLPPGTTSVSDPEAGLITERATMSHIQPKNVVSVERPFDPNPPSPPAASTVRTSPAPVAVDNPEEFEWRNLKKLVVLVLSSLVWRSPVVQDQVRKHGGVELILQCCNYDSHNPYIREHAIMCLRFLLEGNEENAKIVRDLEPRQTVPDEVLDQRGYETFIDATGKVGLRRKDA